MATNLDTDLIVRVAVPAGDDRPATMFGIPVVFAGAALPPFRDGDELTTIGQRVANHVLVELDGFEASYGRRPERIILHVDPPPGHADVAQADHATAVAEAAAELDSRPVPTRGVHRSELEAAAKVAGAVGSARRSALHALIVAGDTGLTDYELAMACDAIPNRIATRRKELQEAGLVKATGARRPTPAHIMAAVHVVTELGVAVWQHIA